MSLEAYQKYRTAAHEARRGGEFQRAAVSYTTAAYEILGYSELERTHDLTSGIVSLQRAAICFRLAGEKTLCRNRCHQAILVIEDALERIYDEEPIVGVSHELIGDCRLIGSMPGYDDEYEAARDIYADYEDESIHWQPEDELQLGLGPFLQVCWALDHEIEDAGKVVTTSLLSRIDYKKEHYPELLEALDEQGEWVWEDETEDSENP